MIDFLKDRHDVASEETRANAMGNLAHVFVRRGRLSEAAAPSRRALNVYETLPGAYAGNLIKGLANLAMITATSGDPSESVITGGQ